MHNVLRPFTLCLSVSSADNLGKQFGHRSGPTIPSGLISVQTVRHSDGIPEEFFPIVHFEKNQQTKKNREKLPSMQGVQEEVKVNLSGHSCDNTSVK